MVDKEEVIACSKDVASDVMARALVLGEKGRTQSISAQTHIADVCVRLTGNKLIRLGKGLVISWRVTIPFRPCSRGGR